MKLTNPIKAFLRHYLNDQVRAGIRSGLAAQADTYRHQSSQGIGSDWQPTEYGEYYAKNVPIYAAIRIRANALIRTPWQVDQPDSTGRFAPVPPNDQLLQLLNHPNPWQTGADLRVATETYLGLWGRCFWTIERDPETNQLTIWTVRPDRMHVIPGEGPTGPYIKGYVYRGTIRSVAYLPEDVHYFYYFNPLEERTGLSPIAPLRRSADMYQDAILYNRNAFRNGAIPDYLLLGDQDMTDQQAEEFYKRWEQRYQGPDRAHRPAIASSIKDVKTLAFSNRDLEYLGSLKEGIHEVSRAYGVPVPMLAELSDATLNNIRNLEGWFWRVTMLPETNWLAEHINTGLLPKLGYPDHRVSFNTTFIDGLGEREDFKINRHKELLDRGAITINETRQDYGLPPVSWGDEPHFRDRVIETSTTQTPSSTHLNGHHAQTPNPHQ